MDANKLAKLKEVGYVFGPTCWLCQHAFFPRVGAAWGTCDKHSYDHLKHSDTTRKMSIHRLGHCEDGFELDVAEARNLGTFIEFLDERSFIMLKLKEGE